MIYWHELFEKWVFESGEAFEILCECHNDSQDLAFDMGLIKEVKYI